MAARPVSPASMNLHGGAAAERAVSSVRSRLVLATAALVAAAALAAACSGASPAADPAVPAAGDRSTPSVDGAASTPGSDDQAGGGPATSAEGDGPTGDTPSTTGAESLEDEASEGVVAEAGSPEDEASEGVVADPGSPEDATPEGGPAEDAAPGGGAPDVELPEGLAGFDPFVIGPIAPLTGSLTNDLSLGQRRAVAVKIGNGDPRDRPQAGLGAADIVYEVLVEAGFTRFLAVFHSEFPIRIGPVRSVRSSDFDILEDLATPYLVSSGANSTVLREMRQAAREGTLVDIGAWRMSAPYARDRSRVAPHNLYFRYETLGGGDSESLPGGVPDAPATTLLHYGSANPPGLPGAAGVTVAYRVLYGTEVSHVWDNALGGWVRIQRGALHTTETDFGVTEIAPANVVVVWMPYGRSAADRRSPQAFSYGSGEALVLTAGAVHEARWERTEDRAGFRFTDTAGNPLSLSAGSTWLLLANDSRPWPRAEVTVLTASEGARLLADARAAAAANGAAGS